MQTKDSGVKMVPEVFLPRLLATKVSLLDKLSMSSFRLHLLPKIHMVDGKYCSS